MWECAIIIYLAQGGFFQLTEHYWTGLTNKLNLTLLASACFYFLFGTHAICCCFFMSMWKHMRKKESEGEIHGDWKIKHHMMGTVIASETTEHIKKSPPFLACFIASSSPLDGIITLFVLRKRKMAETIQTTAHPRGEIVPCDMDLLWHSDRDL